MKLIGHSYHREIHQISILSNLELAFACQIVAHSRPYMAAVGEIIYDVGDIAECMSFIMRGTVQILVDTVKKSNTLMGASTSNGLFGDFEFNLESKNCMRCVRMARYQVGNIYI